MIMDPGTAAFAEMRDKLRQLVLAHTVSGSQHQRTALQMVDDHMRRYVPRILSIDCHECRKTIEGVSWTDRPVSKGGPPMNAEISEIVDSWGFMQFERLAVCAACTLSAEQGDFIHIKCHKCLDEGYIGDIYNPKKTDEPLLIDQLYRQTFKKPPLRNEHLRQTLENARRFVLTDEMTAFWVDLTWKAFHGMAGDGMPQSQIPRFGRKLLKRLDEFRHFSRLPHKVTWLECSREARNNRMQEIMQANDMPLTTYNADGSIRSEDFDREVWEGSGQRCGYLMVQHEQVETAFTCTEFFNFEAGNPLVEFRAAALCWQTDGDPLPWACKAPPSFRGFNTGSELATGMCGYIRDNVGFRPIGRKGELNDTELARYAHATVTAKGVLRYLWTFLATINKIPLIGQQEVRRSHGFVARGRYRQFLSHQIITLHVPERARAKVINKALIEIHRRAHMVRGHWRDDWHLPKGNKTLWIAEHQRGDASLGFVTHDYSVKHEQKKERVE
jgi:hypothetical protein